MTEIRIDINADLGESPEALADGSDLELMEYISSANVACGGHAGDARTMEQVLSAAKRMKVAVGAHPSYPDRANFGRIEMQLEPAEIEASVQDQITALSQIAKALDLQLVHVKPHGALYHAANHRGDVAQAIGRAVLACNPRLIMVGQATSSALESLALDTWRDMGLRCIAEAFADRAYQPDGTLRKRTLPGALLDSPDSAAQQALDIALRHKVIAGTSALSVNAGTICIHSDTPNSLAIAREVNRRLIQAGVMIASP
jgi:UPF0271 protein